MSSGMTKPRPSATASTRAHLKRAMPLRVLRPVATSLDQPFDYGDDTFAQCVRVFPTKAVPKRGPRIRRSLPSIRRMAGVSEYFIRGTRLSSAIFRHEFVLGTSMPSSERYISGWRTPMSAPSRAAEHPGRRISSFGKLAK